MMKYFSVCSGIGGFELGLLKADKNSQCVGYSEIDKHAIKIYQEHFPDHKNYGDITKIKPEELPDFDILVGGFPCQAFSIAGDRQGFNDARGTIFFDIARIVKQKRPNLLLLENVKGLLSHDNGGTFYRIISTLDELGYDLQWQLLNSKNWVPQNRERVFIVGHLRGTPRPEVFPLGEDDSGDGHPADSEEETSLCLSTRTGNRLDPTTQTYIADPAEDPVSPTLTGSGGHSAGMHSDMLLIGTLRTYKDGKGFRESKSGLVPTIPARARNDGSGQPVIIQRARGYNEGGIHDISPALGSSSWEHNNHLMYVGSVGSPRKDTEGQEHLSRAHKQPARVYDENGISPTLSAGETQGRYNILTQGRIRRLTPLECERLQGFPDFWTRVGREKSDFDGVKRNGYISDTQRYKTLGNAVTVSVVERIAKKLV